jgi:hypothetical protein
LGETVGTLHAARAPALLPGIIDELGGQGLLRTLLHCCCEPVLSFNRGSFRRPVLSRDLVRLSSSTSGLATIRYSLTTLHHESLLRDLIRLRL